MGLQQSDVAAFLETMMEGFVGWFSPDCPMTGTLRQERTSPWFNCAANAAARMRSLKWQS